MRARGAPSLPERGAARAQVRTPLNGCLASAEMLLDTPLGAEQRELAKTIRVSGSILLSTVSNFLDFFKMEAGKQLDVVRTEMDVEARRPAPRALLSGLIFTSSVCMREVLECGKLYSVTRWGFARKCVR
jgi:hypothetical protein